MKRIFIYARHSIFSQGLQQLLDAQPNFEVVGWESDPQAAVRCIEEVVPDTILIVHKNDRPDRLPEAWYLLRAVVGKTRIVALNAENNQACVFWGEQCAVSELGELMRLIEAPMTSFSERFCPTK